jgi:hypothetical protein
MTMIFDILLVHDDLTFPMVTPPHDEPSGSDLRGIEGGLATLTSSKVVTL